MNPTNTDGSIVLLPCNGLSARGQITRFVADQIREQIDDIEVVELVPLMAGIPGAVETLRRAKRVIGLSGCEHRCESNGCEMARGKAPDDTFTVGDLVRSDVQSIDSFAPEEMKQCSLQVSSLLLGKLSEVG